jgi:excisionase family DNA binding protein
MVKASNYMTTAEAAKALGVSVIRVRQFAEKGRIHSIRLGPIIVFDSRDIEKFAAIPRVHGRPKEKRK